jgi:LysM repeat protein
LLSACGGQVISGPTPTPHSLAVILPSPTSLSTLSPRQLTPEPTATPAPTPTPVIYVVEPGDTLLGIALQYDVTVDELQAVNGVLSPETLQIGQRLIIPVGGFVVPASSGGIQLPTPTPVGVEVQHTALYQTPVGSIWVLGEVHNPGATALENVQVQVTLLDATGQAVAVDAQFVAVEAVLPDGRAPFGVLFSNPPAGAVSFQANAIRAEVSRNVEARYVQLQVQDPQPKLDGSIYQLTGSIVNGSTRNAVQVHLIATIYDADRRVIGYRRSILGDGSIGAGGSLPFDVIVSADPSAQSVADYSIVAQGRVGQ